MVFRADSKSVTSGKIMKISNNSRDIQGVWKYSDNYLSVKFLLEIFGQTLFAEKFHSRLYFPTFSTFSSVLTVSIVVDKTSTALISTFCPISGGLGSLIIELSLTKTLSYHPKVTLYFKIGRQIYVGSFFLHKLRSKVNFQNPKNHAN